MIGAFITGSHAYGSPKAESDIDLVILCDQRTSEILRAHSEDGADCSADSQIRFGALNIIDFTDPAEFLAWHLATQQLMSQAPVTRREAIDEIERQVDAMPESQVRILAKELWAKMQVAASSFPSPDRGVVDNPDGRRVPAARAADSSDPDLFA